MMASIVTNINPIDIKPKEYCANNISFKYNLLSAAKARQDVYENKYNKLNNFPYALKENDHISIQKIFSDN